MKFKKKPEIIEAYLFDGTYNTMERIKKIFPDIKTFSVEFHIENNTAYNWKIDTYEGRYIVTENDWIIKDSLGRFSICNNHIFTHLYDVFE